MSEEIYTVGQTASFTKTVTETDVVLFAGISGDLNPAHVDEVAAKQSMFKGRVAHGILGASFISAVIGMKLPGPGTLYLSQDLQFVKPIYFNDTVTATVTIKEVGRRGRLTLETKLTNQDGKELITCEAKVFAPK